MFSQLFAVAVLAVAARSVFAAECTRSYTVQDGDICDTISQSHNVSTWQLATVNTGSINGDCTNLIPGQTICLGLKPEEDCSTTYTVAIGDTCENIASNNALNSTILYLNNPQINDDCSNIYTGEVLCTAKTVQVPPTPATGVTLPAPGTTTTVLPSTTPASAPTPVSPTPVVNVAPISSPSPAANNNNNNNGGDNDNNNGGDNDYNNGGDNDYTNDGDDDDLPFCDEI